MSIAYAHGSRPSPHAPAIPDKAGFRSFGQLNAHLSALRDHLAAEAPFPQPAPTYCPHCCRRDGIRPQPGAYRRRCDTHEWYDLECPACHQGNFEAGCSWCGATGYVFTDDVDLACYVFDLPWPASTCRDSWLAEAIAVEGRDWDQGSYDDIELGWEWYAHRLDDLLKGPWAGKPFAEAAKLVFIGQMSGHVAQQTQ